MAARKMKSFFGLVPGLNDTITGEGLRSELVRNGIGSMLLKISYVLLILQRRVGTVRPYWVVSSCTQPSEVAVNDTTLRRNIRQLEY